MTSDLPSDFDESAAHGTVDEQGQVTVTRVTDVVEVIDTVEVVETVRPDGGIQREVVAVEHAEREVIEVEAVELDAVELNGVEFDGAQVEVVELEGADVRIPDLGGDEDRVATQGALPLDVRTGDAGVDAAVAQLRDLDDRPVAEHAEVFTAVHRALQDALVDLDRS